MSLTGTSHAAIGPYRPGEGTDAYKPEDVSSPTMELFGTAGIRGDAAERITPSLAVSVGCAVGAEAEELVLGRDGRVTGPALLAALEAGAASAGAKVRRLGRLPTPALAFASRDCYGIMVTASHNPPTDNGLKLFDDGEEFDREAELAIAAAVDEGPRPANWDAWTQPQSASALNAYRREVIEYAEKIGSSPENLKIAVDCGNGVAADSTPAVLRELGADVVTLNANVDGRFPGRESKPTADSLTDFRRFIANVNGYSAPSTADRTDRDDSVDDRDAPTSNAASGTDAIDFGVGHDGDADRIVIVDRRGQIIHEDTVLAILAEQYVSQSGANDPVVVTTPNASGRIDTRVQEAGGRVERVRLGALHEGITRVHELAETDADTDVVFAAEPWKHIHPELGHWIDGITSAAILARLVAAASLAALREPIDERPYRKVSIRCPDPVKQPAMVELEQRLPEKFPDSEVETEHGVRLSFADGSWALVRPSGTEAYLRLYAESDAVDNLITDVKSHVESAIDAG